MADGPGWSAAQWETVNSAVAEAFQKASVTSKFLPRYGPLSDSAEYVKAERLNGGQIANVSVEDDRTLKLFNLTVNVDLSREQVSEESLSAALLVMRRAANTLAQVEDYLVFNGFAADLPTFQTSEEANTAIRNARQGLDAALKARTIKFDPLRTSRLYGEPEREKHTVEDADLLARAAEAAFRRVRTAQVIKAKPTDAQPGLTEINRSVRFSAAMRPGNSGGDVGEELVLAVVAATSALEDGSHPGPFACVLGTDLYTEAHRPRPDSMVLPADRITPLLNGPLLRGGQMDTESGIVVSLSGNDIDVVVATPPRVEFLQVTVTARYLFRVYEKFTWRLKDETAVQTLGTLLKGTRKVE